MVIQRSGPVEGTPAEASVFLTTLTSGPVSRADIARLTGLSSAAVTRAATPLLEAGYLEFAHEATPADEVRMGRPSSPLQVRALHTGAIGIKITRDELIGVVCDLAGEPRTSQRVTLESSDPDATIDAIAAMYTSLVSSADALGLTRPARHLGVSVSGDVDHETGLVRYSPFLGWRDVELGPRVATKIGAPVVVENDVKALTVAEQWFGLGRGATSFALVTIGTGIGCAIVVDGQLVRGAHSVAGEIGHLPIGERTVLCHCGAHGCVEAEASTTALLAAARSATGRPDLTSEQAVDLAREGDDAVAAIFARGGRLIGLALASVANILGPDQIIVAGEGVSTYDLFEASIREAFAEQAFGAAHQVPIDVQNLPFEEWARGAAAVAIESLVFPSRAHAAETRRRHGGSRG